ncbi:MAG: hypothetical protein M1812_000503 [Candelaria pacifica]|nr:MAG: hypothetical protein M1812_000503 [Candelaria pacifica]
MQGLVSYESSDGDSDDDKVAQKMSNGSKVAIAAPQASALDKDHEGCDAVSRLTQTQEPLPTVRPTSPQNAPTQGPMVGPPGPPRSPVPTNGATSRPQSPYSNSRSLIRDLTLPPIPNLDIPPSPPGSPPPSTNAKFAHFLELKKQGVHFNEKLAKSSALKNPSLLQKLMGFAGIDEKAQYATTLPKEIWDPDGFPKWAYKDELAKSQQVVLKRREEEKAKAQRDAVEFVPATTSTDSSRSGTPGAFGSGRGLRASAAERVMAGLDRERGKAPLVTEPPKRRDLERRAGRNDGYRSRDRSRSRSPGRHRRSRSR